MACIYMLYDVLHTLDKLHSCFQAKQLNLAMVLVMVDNVIFPLKELKEDLRPAHSSRTIQIYSNSLWEKTQGFQKVIKNASMV